LNDKPSTSASIDDHDLILDARLQATLSSSVDGIVIITESGEIESFNRAAEDMFGYRSREVIGEDVAILMPHSYAEEHKKRVRTYMQTRRSDAIGIHREVTGRRKDGTTFPIDIALGIAELADQKLITGVVRDITERKLIERELQKHRLQLEQMVRDKTRELEIANRDLERLSQIDGLTNIFNRRYFDEALDWELKHARRSKESIVLMVCDIDWFKQFNDNYGHVAGDNCLRRVAGKIRACCQRETDIVARYGGEEFVVLFPGSGAAGSRRAEHIRQGIWDLNIPHRGSRIADRITVSLGVARIVPGKRTSAHGLIECVDRALYAAKSSGRNRVEVAAGEPDAARNEWILEE